jgi:hypothetical protein
MKFEYPYAAPSVDVELRDPALGDSLQHNTQIRYGKAMSGTFYTYKYTPATRRWLWTFEAIKKSLKDEFIDFIRQSSGREIKVTMYDSTILRGYISNINPMESTSVRDIPDSGDSSDACVEEYNIVVEFEGEVV